MTLAFVAARYPQSKLTHPMHPDCNGATRIADSSLNLLCAVILERTNKSSFRLSNCFLILNNSEHRVKVPPLCKLLI